jgi:hypothetical protein
LALTASGPSTSRPEIQLFAAGSPDALSRTVDVAALSSWLAVRAIDRETRRLDAIERGEPPPVFPPYATAPDAVLPGQPPLDPTIPGRDPRRLQPKPRVSGPRPPAAVVPPTPAAPPTAATPPNANAPVVSQQIAPLPPPIEVHPAPGVLRPAKPRPPLVLTPPPPPAPPPRSLF